jgi:alkylation response protein AidB-like acyl-CoA dehydrogenase
MDFLLSEEQKTMLRVARRFLEKECSAKVVREIESSETGYAPELWRKAADLGWMAMPFPEKYGGVDGSFLDLILILEEMGRACFPSPFISSVVLGGLTILDLGTEAQKEHFLPSIASGESICTLALLESTDSYDPTVISCHASSDGNGFHLSGTKLFVPDFQAADLLLVVARTEAGLPFFVVEKSKSSIPAYPFKTVSGDRLFELLLDLPLSADSMLGATEGGGQGLKRTLERAAVAKCAEMVGGAQKVLEMTLGYVKEREQFGRPIGSYQAIQHHCANMAIDVEASRLNTYHAAWLISAGLPASRHAAAAKAVVSEAYRRVVALSHQIYGAIGFTKELDLELYIRRAKGGEVAFGDADFQWNALARELVDEEEAHP